MALAGSVASDRRIGCGLVAEHMRLPDCIGAFVLGHSRRATWHWERGMELDSKSDNMVDATTNAAGGTPGAALLESR